MQTLHNTPRRRAAVMALACLQVLLCLLWAVTAVTALETPLATPPYLFCMDKTSLQAIEGTSGSEMVVKRDAYLPQGGSITLAGWLSTERGIAGYRYLWVPAGGGYADWQEVDTTPHARPDLTGAGIPYKGGHSTAGFNFTITPPADTEKGYYDLYIRAVDTAGAFVDLIVLPHLRYGQVDEDDGRVRRVDLGRLAEEGVEDPSVLQHGAEIRTDGLYLPDGGTVCFGELDLSGFDALTLTYRTVSGRSPTGQTSVLALNTSDRYPLCAQEGRSGYDLTDTLVHVVPYGSEGEVVLDLSDITHRGKVFLVGCLSEPILITEIALAYQGNGSDRYAAEIHLSASLLPDRFSGANKVSTTGVSDPQMGDVLRISVSENTNDPFVHFDASAVLADAEISLSADTYKYMVVLYRSNARGGQATGSFYLCAGNIFGATGECVYSFHMVNDGQWHYALLDLTKTEKWTGRINGWRFDILNGDCVVGDTVDYATVQFFRTKEGAEAAASADPATATPYRIGDPVVFLDDTEERAAQGTLSPDQIYTAPETQPETEGVWPAETEGGLVTDPLDTGVAESDLSESLPPVFETEGVGETAGEAEGDRPFESTYESETVAMAGEGCRSALSAWPFAVLLAAVALLFHRRRHS